MVAHIHAALMAEYAKDSLHSQEAWRGWESWAPGCGNGCGNGWQGLHSIPAWIVTSKYRRKVKTIKIGEREVAAPLRCPPETTKVVYYTTLVGQSSFVYEGTDYDVKMLEQGLLFNSMPDCVAANEAILELLKGSKCSNG